MDYLWEFNTLFQKINKDWNSIFKGLKITQMFISYDLVP